MARTGGNSPSIVNYTVVCLLFILPLCRFAKAVPVPVQHQALTMPDEPCTWPSTSPTTPLLPTTLQDRSDSSAPIGTTSSPLLYHVPRDSLQRRNLKWYTETYTNWFNDHILNVHGFLHPQEAYDHKAENDEQRAALAKKQKAACKDNAESASCKYFESANWLDRVLKPVQDFVYWVDEWGFGIYGKLYGKFQAIRAGTKPVGPPRGDPGLIGNKRRLRRRGFDSKPAFSSFIGRIFMGG